jgi:transposase
MEAENRNRFYKVEFKEAAIKLALESNNSVSQTARELGISPRTLQNWVNVSSKSKDPNMQKNKDTLEEIKKLKKELAQVTLERDILKKATAYFAKESR